MAARLHRPKAQPALAKGFGGGNIADFHLVAKACLELAAGVAQPVNQAQFQGFAARPEAAVEELFLGRLELARRRSLTIALKL